MKLIQLIVPHGLDFDKVVEMFTLNDILVDDMCTVFHEGRVIQIWVEDEDVYNCSLNEKVGPFLNEKF